MARRFEDVYACTTAGARYAANLLLGEPAGRRYCSDAATRRSMWHFIGMVVKLQGLFKKAVKQALSREI